MGITFYLPILQRSLGQSFYLMDGDKHFYPTWIVGDEVSVMMPVTREQATILRSKVNGIGTTNGSGSADVTAHIPCKVARRLHAINWTEVGTFHAVCNGDVVLEPINVQCEELLVWIATGDRPQWAD